MMAPLFDHLGFVYDTSKFLKARDRRLLKKISEARHALIVIVPVKRERETTATTNTN
jgi:hypothetical protein